MKHVCGPLHAKGTDVAMEEMVLAYERQPLTHVDPRDRLAAVPALIPDSDPGGPAPARTMTVQLLGTDLAVVLTWRFHRAHPVSVSYSPLRASTDDLVMETGELAFERVEMA